MGRKREIDTSQLIRKIVTAVVVVVVMGWNCISLVGVYLEKNGGARLEQKQGKKSIR